MPPKALVLSGPGGKFDFVGGRERTPRQRPAPQSAKLGVVHAGADAAGIDQLSVRIVVAEEQGAEPRP